VLSEQLLPVLQKISSLMTLLTSEYLASGACQKVHPVEDNPPADAERQDWVTRVILNP